MPPPLNGASGSLPDIITSNLGGDSGSGGCGGGASASASPEGEGRGWGEGAESVRLTGWVKWCVGSGRSKEKDKKGKNKYCSRSRLDWIGLGERCSSCSGRIKY